MARRVLRSSLHCVAAIAVVAGAVQAATPRAAPSTILVGQSWLGVWRGGKVAVSREMAGWQFNASRISADGGSVLVAAYRAGSAQAKPVVLRFDARTLAPRGRATDPGLLQSPAAVPVGTDTGVPDAVQAGALKATPDAGGLAVTLAAGGTAHRLASGAWRLAVSPDGSTAAAFAKPADPAAGWPGQAWDARTGAPVAARGLTIDDGARRETGAAKALGCLLPRGEGAVFTYLGAPADRTSEFQSFAGAAAPQPLRTPYVMSCLAVPSR